MVFFVYGDEAGGLVAEGFLQTLISRLAIEFFTCIAHKHQCQVSVTCVLEDTDPQNVGKQIHHCHAGRETRLARHRRTLYFR
jgi:hypothetical protein